MTTDKVYAAMFACLNKTSKHLLSTSSKEFCLSAMLFLKQRNLQGFVDCLAKAVHAEYFAWSSYPEELGILPKPLRVGGENLARVFRVYMRFRTKVLNQHARALSHSSQAIPPGDQPPSQHS